MKVYIVMLYVEYEGGTFVSAHSTLEKARLRAEELDDADKSLGFGAGHGVIEADVE